MPYTEGFHGTDEPTARKLLEEGFRKTTDNGFSRYLFLAAPFQTYLAHSHGLKNAERSNSENYAIIKTIIPESKVMHNDLGPESLRLFGEDIDQIAVIGLSVYTKTGELIEGDPIEETHEWNWIP